MRKYGYLVFMGLVLSCVCFMFLAGCAGPSVTPVGPLFTNKDLPTIQVDPKLLQSCKPSLSLLEVEEPDFTDMKKLIAQHVKDYAECKSKDESKLEFINNLMQTLPEQVKPNGQ